jgi:hypothetical protein
LTLPVGLGLSLLGSNYSSLIRPLFRLSLLHESRVVSVIEECLERLGVIAESAFDSHSSNLGL